MSLELKNITVEIGKNKLVKNVSFKTNHGEFIAIVGANGAGKSTCLKAISGELKPNDGSIEWRHLPITDLDNSTLARTRSVMSQQTFMSIDFSVEEVVMMGRYPHFESSPKSLDFKIVKQEIERIGLSHLTKRSYSTLSGGEKQRVQIARAFAQIAETDQPTFMLLDEPLNNLDIKYQHQCLDLTKAYVKQGNVALMVIHDINLAALYADKIALLHQGELLAFGTPEQVITEALLTHAYDFKVRVEKHPHHQCPIAYFGCPSLVHESDQISIKQHTTQENGNY